MLIAFHVADGVRSLLVDVPAAETRKIDAPLTRSDRKTKRKVRWRRWASYRNRLHHRAKYPLWLAKMRPLPVPVCARPGVKSGPPSKSLHADTRVRPREPASVRSNPPSSHERLTRDREHGRRLAVSYARIGVEDLEAT